MRERVTVVQGRAPVALVAPHGPDEVNTALIVETAAARLGCSAVVNRAFRRADRVDVLADLADCNRLDHLKQPVVQDEALLPLVRLRRRAVGRGVRAGADVYQAPHFHVFHVLGCGNTVHREAGEEVALVVGYGRGVRKDSLTCDEWRKDSFVDACRRHLTGGAFGVEGDVYEGAGGGRFTGRDSNLANQYFRKHAPDMRVSSMQLAVPLMHRLGTAAATYFGEFLAAAIEDHLGREDFWGSPAVKAI